MQNDDPNRINLENLLIRIGADAEQAQRMAPQLIKRARQIAVERNITEAEALQGLLEKIREARS